jgi:tRNA A-37 threonylcarbamoyl transferase component Bud32
LTNPLLLLLVSSAPPATYADAVVGKIKSATDCGLPKRGTVHEARVLARCRASGILAPAVYFVDDSTQTIYMEFIEGKTVKDVWDEQNLKSSNSN